MEKKYQIIFFGLFLFDVACATQIVPEGQLKPQKNGSFLSRFNCFFTGNNRKVSPDPNMHCLKHHENVTPDLSFEEFAEKAAPYVRNFLAGEKINSQKKDFNFNFLKDVLENYMRFLNPQNTNPHLEETKGYLSKTIEILQGGSTEDLTSFVIELLKYMDPYFQKKDEPLLEDEKKINSVDSEDFHQSKNMIFENENNDLYLKYIDAVFVLSALLYAENRLDEFLENAKLKAETQKNLCQLMEVHLDDVSPMPIFANKLGLLALTKCLTQKSKSNDEKTLLSRDSYAKQLNRSSRRVGVQKSKEDCILDKVKMYNDLCAPTSNGRDPNQRRLAVASIFPQG